MLMSQVMRKFEGSAMRSVETTRGRRAVSTPRLCRDRAGGFGELQGSMEINGPTVSPITWFQVVRRNAAPSCADHDNEFGLIVSNVVVELTLSVAPARHDGNFVKTSGREIHVAVGVPGVIQADGEDGSWAWDWWSGTALATTPSGDRLLSWMVCSSA